MEELSNKVYRIEQDGSHCYCLLLVFLLLCWYCCCCNGIAVVVMVLLFCVGSIDRLKKIKQLQQEENNECVRLFFF